MNNREEALLKLDKLVTDLTVRDLPFWGAHEAHRHLEDEINQILIQLRTDSNFLPSPEDFSDEIAEIKRKREMGQLMENEYLFQVGPKLEPEPFTLIFQRDNASFGTLRFSKDGVMFEGDADAAAKVFIECLVQRQCSEWKAAQARIAELETENTAYKQRDLARMRQNVMDTLFSTGEVEWEIDEYLVQWDEEHPEAAAAYHALNKAQK